MREREQVEVESVAALRAWLSAHYQQSDSIWLVTFKKAEERYLPYDSIIEEALAFGWVDSLSRALDDKRTMRLLSPRKPGSAWSKANKDRVARLIRSKRMHPSGLAKVEAAQRDGSWTKIDRAQSLEIPDDLTAALEANRQAKGHFSKFPPSTRRAILEWVEGAKTCATRERRIGRTVADAAENRRANQYRQLS